MRIGPSPDILWRIIRANPSYYRRLGYDSPPPSKANHQAISRFLLQADKPERFAMKLETEGASFKTDHRLDQIGKFFRGDRRQASLGLDLMDHLRFSYEHIEQVMFTERQLVDPGGVRFREGKPGDAAEIERLGREHLGDLQSPASRIQSRMRAGYERSRIAEDEASSLVRGYLRWWVLTARGVQQVLDGHALTGGDLRDSDLSVHHWPPPPDGALYLVMLLGTDTVACIRVVEEATKLVNAYEQKGLPTFTRPTTPDGFRLVEPSHRRFKPVPQPGSHIYVRRTQEVRA